MKQTNESDTRTPEGGKKSYDLYTMRLLKHTSALETRRKDGKDTAYVGAVSGVKNKLVWDATPFARG